MNHNASTQTRTGHLVGPLSLVFTSRAMMFSLLLFLVVGIAGVPVVHANNADTQLTCQSRRWDLGQYKIFGQLCMRSNQAATLVQVLLPGASYSHGYWDWPYQPLTYSYVQAETTPNFATFALDRLGSGQSTQPASQLVTLDADADTVHQVIQGLRQGTIGGVKFNKVILVGHSLGSYVLWDEVGRYHDVDGAIVTGALHKSSPSGINTFFPLLYPATQDPKFQNSGLDSGYYTTKPGGRATLFYHTADADKQVIAVDEANKDVFALNESFQGVDPANLARTNTIIVPVLDVVGQFDLIFCAPDATDCSSDQTVQAAEAPFYPPQACLEAHILPGSGHDINLHLNAQDWFGLAKKWLNKFFGDDPVQPGHCN